MGIEFYVVDRKNRRRFRLGKGNWWTDRTASPMAAIIDCDRVGIAHSTEDVRCAVGLAWAEDVAKGGASVEPTDYIDRLSACLFTFLEAAGWDVCMIHDAGDWFEWDGAPIVGSRYESDYIDGRFTLEE